MKAADRKLAQKKAGKKAADEVRSEFTKLCEEREAGPGYVVDNLIRLSRFRGKKPFLPRGAKKAKDLIYSAPLDAPEVQLGAIKILGEWQALKPADRQEVHHRFGNLNDEQLDERIKQLLGQLSGDKQE